MSQAIDFTTVPIHLGLGATATPLPDFGWAPQQLAAYNERFASDGNEGRLVMMGRQEADWPTWERHPAGEEVVALLTGRADLIQWIDGTEHVVPMQEGQAIVNPAGVWHTAKVHEAGWILTITPGKGTENVPIEQFPPE